MILHPSPNFDDRPAPGRIKYLILHYTGMATGQAALERLCDPASAVSAHYMIEEDGRIFSLVAEDKRAWHAGVSSWGGERNINGLSLGIELVNPGHDAPGYRGDYRNFPDEQITSLIELCRDILARYDIRPRHILGHSDVAPERKCDPGERFDWSRLARAGIGLWPEDNIPSGSMPDMATFQRKLAAYGYPVEITGTDDQQTRAVISAFQRHFRPAEITGIADGECSALLDYLLGRAKITGPV